MNYTAEFKNNSSFISTKNIGNILVSTESYQQMLPDYEDLIKSL